MANKPSIILVDSDQKSRSLLLGVLHALHIKQVISISTSTEYMSIAKSEESHDIVICDLDVKPTGAKTLIKMTRWGTDSQFKNMGIIVTSSQIDAAMLVSMRDVGVNCLLLKPFTPRSVHARLSSIVQQAKQQFIYSADYIGPNRRIGLKSYSGSERRNLAPPLKHVYTQTMEEIMGKSIAALPITPTLNSILKNDNPAHSKGPAQGEQRVIVSGLQEGMTLNKDCVTTTGLVVVRAGTALSKRTIRRLVDMVHHGKLTDNFHIRH